MATETKARGTSMSITTVLFIVFLVLKLTGTIHWSWWWVFSPFWIPLSIALVACLIVGIAEVAQESLDS